MILRGRFGALLLHLEGEEEKEEEKEEEDDNDDDDDCDIEREGRSTATSLGRQRLNDREPGSRNLLLLQDSLPEIERKKTSENLCFDVPSYSLKHRKSVCTSQI